MQRAADFEQQQRAAKMEQFLDRTAALDKAKAQAMAKRVEAARSMGLKARALNEESKIQRAESERKQFAESQAQLMSFRSQSELGFNKSIDESALNRSLEDQLSFCSKLSTPIKRMSADEEYMQKKGKRPGSAGIAMTWHDRIAPPKKTWGELEREVYGG